MTTHIIGKPTAPKGGATFADVPVGGVCFPGSRAVGTKLQGGKIRYHWTGEVEAIPADTPVMVCTIEYAEPDPDVCTYGELEPKRGEWFVWELEEHADGLCRRVANGYMNGDGWFVPVESAEWMSRPIRRVSASVVEHEEPGSVTRPFGGRYGANPVIHIDDPNDEEAVTLTPEQARRAVAELCSWLSAVSQQAASPESGELEPTELQAGDHIDVVFEGHSDDVHDLRVGIVKREPAEDRSKPAPGWRYPYLSQGAWFVERTCHRDGKNFALRSDAIAWTWTQHDAQQAGEGGE